MKRPLALIANGEAPAHPQVMAALTACGGAVCCDRLPPDGAPELLQVVGDMDTLRGALPEGLVTDLHEDQETNDLTKAMRWAKAFDPEAELHFFAVTGKREDHTLANLALIYEAGERAELFTNAGHFILLPPGTHRLDVEAGSAVSFLSFTPQSLTVKGVQWPVEALRLESLWRATLNRCVETTLILTAEAPLYVYQPWSHA